MGKKYILGNWKMNGLRTDAAALAEKIAGHKAPADTEVVLFPPFTLIDVVSKSLKSGPVLLGAQDASTEESGAFTGDISARQLRDLGCAYVLLGHSERRTHHGETDALVKAKAEAVMKAGLIAVICVGESEAERESGDHLNVLRAQVENSVPRNAKNGFLVAYEPVWAIGSGKTPTIAQISEAHKTIASLLSYGTSGARPAIAYGGSVKAANAREILTAPGVDGVLVGGASLKPEEFCAIITAAH